MFAQQEVQDLLPLAMVEVPLDADDDHHVVAHGSPSEKGFLGTGQIVVTSGTV